MCIQYSYIYKCSAVQITQGPAANPTICRKAGQNSQRREDLSRAAVEHRVILDGEVQAMRCPLTRATVTGTEVSMARRARIIYTTLVQRTDCQLLLRGCRDDAPDQHAQRR